MKVKFIKVLDDRSGTTSSGHDWRDVQFLCETTDERPRKIALNSKGDACAKIKNMRADDIFNVSYDIVSNESRDGRWFTKAVVWSVQLQAGDPPKSSYTNAGSASGNSQPPTEEFSDFPF
ncbi:MAG TPA: DUF3127 domain-containing protein [Saprospiraceae bacterium]|nr:DUF3127 domain-containing protein [Saprospiraceae bacterium]HNG89901.1 DUF3127 domain-containing protein [Saprospiraceae bacterium]